MPPPAIRSLRRRPTSQLLPAHGHLLGHVCAAATEPACLLDGCLLCGAVLQLLQSATAAHCCLLLRRGCLLLLCRGCLLLPRAAAASYPAPRAGAGEEGAQVTGFNF